MHSAHYQLMLVSILKYSYLHKKQIHLMLSVLPIPSESDSGHIIVSKLGFISDYPFDGVKSVSKMWSTNYWLSLHKFDNRVVHEGGQRVCLVVKGMLSHLTFKTHSQSGSHGSGHKAKTKQSYNAVKCTFEQAQADKCSTQYTYSTTQCTHRMFKTFSMSDRPKRNNSYTSSINTLVKSTFTVTLTLH